MAGYNDTREKILNTLLQRKNGTQIIPENHQDFALNLLEYIRSVELISASTLIGVAHPDTVPVQPDSSNVAYIAGVAQDKIEVFKNFPDSDGNPIQVTTSETEGKLVILTWNRQYWEKQELSTNIISQSDNAYFYYSLTIRKTYDSKAEMELDKLTPIGNNGKSIKVGEVVSVNNDPDEKNNGIYSYEIDDNGNPYWKFQCRFGVLDGSRIKSIDIEYESDEIRITPVYSDGQGVVDLTVESATSEKAGAMSAEHVRKLENLSKNLKDLMDSIESGEKGNIDNAFASLKSRVDILEEEWNDSKGDFVESVRFKQSKEFNLNTDTVYLGLKRLAHNDNEGDWFPMPVATTKQSGVMSSGDMKLLKDVIERRVVGSEVDIDDVNVNIKIYQNTLDSWLNITIPLLRLSEKLPQRAPGFSSPEDYVTKDEVLSLISDIKQFEIVAVSRLPTASEETLKKIYLIPANSATDSNVKDEYITLRIMPESGNPDDVTYTWEKIGDTKVDLTGYAKEVWVQDEIDIAIDSLEKFEPITNEWLDLHLL